MATRQAYLVETAEDWTEEEQQQFERELLDSLASETVVWLPPGVRVTPVTVPVPEDGEKIGPLRKFRT